MAAKLALLFLAFLVVIQLISASRLPRDAPANTESESMKALENAFDSIKKGLEDTFSKDNFDKVMSSLNEFGEKLKSVGSDIAVSVKEKTAELTKKD